VRRIAVLDAPSNLGLRPPTPTSVPGCAKAPGALRDHGLLTKLAARDAGCLTPPRYDPGDWRPGDGVAHAAEIAAYSRALADRIGAIIDGGEFPVVLGGDCSILIGSGLAMHRLGEAVGGRIGLVFVDGHSDFRHPGNASYVGAAAGEDLALVTGRGQANLAAIESRRPYFRDVDVVVLGIRAQDEYRLDLQAAGIVTRPVPMLRVEGAARSAQWARDQLVDCAGYWVHVDVDVLDPAVMPAVDAPDPGGIAFPELELLLIGLVESPHCLGVEITVFDPDYDPDGRYAAEITSAVVSGLAPVRTVTPRPDLVAARRDLATGPGRATRAAPAARHAAPDPADDAPAPVPDVAPDPVGTVSPGVPDVAPDPAGTVSPAGPDVAPDPVGDTAPVGAVVPDGAEVATSNGLVTTPIPETPPAAAASPGVTGEDLVVLPEEAEPFAAAADREAEVVPGPEPADATTDDTDPAHAIISDTDPAEAVVSDADPADAIAEGADPAAAISDDGDPGIVVAEDVEADLATVPEDAGPAPVAEGDDDGAGVESPGAVNAETSAGPSTEPEEQPVAVSPEVRLLSRPLGSAPLLDSEPLPATRPGMLRPRPPADPPAAGAFPSHTPQFGKFPPGAA
jgi:arginase